jgi:hypothetical protein
MSDVVYYNITIGTNSTGVDYQKAAIIAQNTLPVIDNPTEYYGSIVRLNIPQFDIPAAYFDVETDSNGNVPDINRGVYKFSIVWGTMTSGGVLTSISQNTQNVMWVQQDFTASPIPLAGVPPTPSTYYFIYDYETIINGWNKAISDAYNVVQSAVGAPLVINQPPFFYYNPNTQIVELYSPQPYSGYNTTGQPFLQIYANDAMENLIHGFKYWNFQDNTLHSLFNIQGYPTNTMTALNTVTVGGTLFYKAQQEYVTLAYWNMLRNIYITSTMPVQQEAYYLGNSNNILGQNVLLQSTLTDYIPDLTVGQQAGVAGAQFIYNASSLWRIFQMNSHTPLYNISAAIYFTDQNGNIWPLELFTKQQCNIKFMFIKKHLLSNLIKSRV